MIGRVVIALLFLLAVSASPAEPVETAHFVLIFDSPQHITEADTILNRTKAQLELLIHDTLSYKPVVYLVSTQAHFDSLIGGGFPDWGAAAAIPERRTIIIKSPDNFNVHRPLRELLAHELSHLALAHRVGFVEAPRWFDEGLAMMVSFEWSWQSDLSMNVAAVFSQFVPLPEIELVNRFPESKAQVSYAESYLAVQYLFTQYGRPAVNLFLDQLASGRTIDSATMAAFGSNYADLDKEIRLYLSGRYNLITLLADTMYFWIGLAVLVIVAGFVRYRRRRRLFREWEQQERLESTDFDYGDPDEPEEPDDDEPWRQ